MNEENKKQSADNLKNTGYVLVILGIVLVAAAYFMIWKKYDTKIEDINNEISDLESRKDDLEDLKAGEKKAKKDTEEAEDEYNKLISRYDGDVTYQSEIMDSYNATQSLKVQIPSLSLCEPDVVYTFGGIASSNPNGGTAGLDPSYAGKMMTYTVTTVGTYDQAKQFLSQIVNNYSKKKVLTTVNFAYDATNQIVTTTANVNEYAITGEDREQSPVNVPAYQNSTTNIFYNVAIQEQ